MDDIFKLKGLHEFWADSQLAGHNAAYLEDLYEQFLADPNRLSSQWRTFFEDLPCINGADTEPMHSAIRQTFRAITRQAVVQRQAATSVPGSRGHEEKQVRVLQLINAYRFRGHQIAQIDPLNLRTPPELPELDLQHHGLSDADLDTVFDTGSLAVTERAPLREILQHLRAIYCGSTGSEYMHITETAEKRWIQQRLEHVGGQAAFSRQAKRRILWRLTAAEGLERYLHTRYVGQKRFSLEGGDSLIALLDELIQRGGTHGVKEVVIGMAHRGRLNVLINIVGKTAAELFQEFEGEAGKSSNGSGDVKYHQGFSSDL
ncbi:MAG: 2-oxoglutarate dehydrogenase E1 component, partial [Thiogranum sp.]